MSINFFSNANFCSMDFKRYKFLSFCSDDDGKLKTKGQVVNTTCQDKLKQFLKKSHNKIVLVTYQSFDNFIDYDATVPNNTYHIHSWRP